MKSNSVSTYKMSADHAILAHLLKMHGYILDCMIGEGANGTCYLVYSEKYQTAFLCKCIQLLHGSERSRLEQYHREIQSLSLLIHKNIVKIYDCFSESNYLFMIMEYCPNGSLADYINKYAKTAKYVNYTFVRKIVTDILLALQYCHDVKHISHHDIKPANIVLDSYGNAKLCDFGFSAIIDRVSALVVDVVTLIISSTASSIARPNWLSN